MNKDKKTSQVFTKEKTITITREKVLVGIIMISAFILGFGIILSFFSQLKPAVAPKPRVITPIYNEKEAIIILSTNTVQEMQRARKIIEKNGGQIKNIFPPSVLTASIPSQIAEALKSTKEIKEVSFDKVDDSLYKDYESSVLDTILLWNKRIEEKSKPEEKTEEPPKEGEEPKETFKDELIMPDDLPKTEEEKIKKDEEYQKHWQQKKEEWLKQEEEKKQAWQEKQAGVEEKEETLDNSLILSIPDEAETRGGSGGNNMAFGGGSGAGYYDTSLYMAGDVAVGIFFQPGSDGNWTTGEINTFFTSTCNALNQFILDEPNAHITFTYTKEIDGEGNPILPPMNVEDKLIYVNDLRNIYQTEWAYMIIVYKGSGLANASYFGPSTNLYSNDLRNGYVVRHETMHIFGAWDQYDGSPVLRWGYMNVVNANSIGNDGNGYFGGAGEGIPDIMIDGSGIINPIGVYSRGQIGWRDANGNGILDPLDTFPDAVIVNKTGTNSITYTGHASDKPLLNEFGNYGDVTLNTITSVEYRINGGAWISATASDGAFDSAEEDYSFTTPELKNGNYTIEVRAINSMGNTEISYAKDEVLIEGSSVTNVQPFAFFSITPPKGSIYTNFNFDASKSSDIEDNSSVLQVRWDFENDGTWNTDYSTNKTITHQYSTAGIKTINLEIKDSGGLTNAVTKQIEVTATNRTPTAYFTATPENQHGDDSDTFNVTLNAQGVYDGEDPSSNLQVRWDFNDDGNWDTDFSNNLSLAHSYTLPIGLPVTKHWRPRLEVVDTSNNASQATRDVWAVTYNHPSSLNDLDIVGNTIYYKFAGSYDTSGYSMNVSVLGNNAYVADGNMGLQILDISNPKTPSFVKNYNTPGVAFDVFVSDNYAYVADGSSGLQIIDPQESNPIGNYNTSGEARGVYVSGNYAYVADGGSGLKIIDISNPESPSLVASYYTTYNANDVFISGNYAYLAGDSLGLKIINISDPQYPYLVGSYNTSAQGVYISGNFAYIAAGGSGLQIINIADPENPFLVGSFEALVNNVNGIFVSADYDYAYIADSYNDPIAGFKIINISNPQSPTLVGNYNTQDNAWGVYVYNNYAYVADLFSGLQIIQVSPGLKLSIDATDPDKNTTWDGLLEYRFDYNNNDQIWETEFSELTDEDVSIPISPYEDISLVCEIRDRFGATSRKNISEQAPVLSPIGHKTAIVDQNLTFQISATDPENDLLTYQVKNLPTGATFVDNGNNTATFFWTPSTSQLGDHKVTFLVSDGMLIDSEEIKIEVTPFSQTINFSANQWNLISFYVLPSNKSLEYVFGEDLSKINIIKTGDGPDELKYDPVNNIHTLANIEFAKSYKVHTTANVSLTIGGHKPESQINIVLKHNEDSGYFNYIGYPSSIGRNIEEAFAPIFDKINIIKSGDGRFYIPNAPYNTLTHLAPGEGYLISVKENVNFIYPSCLDGTFYSQCSSTKPKYCDNGNLIDACGPPHNCGCQVNLPYCNTTSNICEAKCPDGTLFSQCSTTKPKYCDNGNLIDACSSPHNCGCPDGYTCNTTTNQCLPACSDGTLYGQCATYSNRPKYCDNGNLIDACGPPHNCGCQYGYTCNTTTNQCGEDCWDGTPAGQCSTMKPAYCSNGNLIGACGPPHNCGCYGNDYCCPRGACVPSSQSFLCPEQTINLLANTWSLISFNVLPYNTSLQGVFGDNLQYFNFIKTGDGPDALVYDTVNGAYTLTNIEFARSYKVHTTANVTFTVVGYRAIEGMPLKYYAESNYFNYLGFPYPFEKNIESAFAPIMDKINIIKAGDGRFYIPSSPHNTLTKLKPGEGYYISVTEDVSFTYPFCLDGTSSGQCSTLNKGKYCSDISLVDDCLSCGCPENLPYCDEWNSCEPACQDGTYFDMCVDMNQPQYCDNGEIVNNCQVCGCPPEAKVCCKDGSCSSSGCPLPVFD